MQKQEHCLLFITHISLLLIIINSTNETFTHDYAFSMFITGSNFGKPQDIFESKLELGDYCRAIQAI